MQTYKYTYACTYTTWEHFSVSGNSDLHTCNTTTTTTTTTREPQIATKVYFKSWFSGKHHDYWTY